VARLRRLPPARAGVTAVSRARADRVAERRGYVAASLRDAIRGRYTFLKSALMAVTPSG